METFFAFVFAGIALCVVLAIAKSIFMVIFDLIMHGLLPFLVVRFLTWTMQHWMGSTIAWTLSIAAGIIWGIYPRLKQWFNDPRGTIQDIRDREARVARDNAEFNRKYNRQRKSSSDDYNKNEVERCDSDQYE